MTLSRRRLLIAAPAMMAVAAACAHGPTRTVINVRDHGAVGDGVADDSNAIRAAVAALKPGCTLYFPKGTYRVAEKTPKSGAAIRIDGISDLHIEFDSAAELVMDNVDPATNKGTGHGILIHGPASQIVLLNVKIRWAGKPIRSAGDGIRVVGCPTDSDVVPEGWNGPPKPINNVKLLNCNIQSSAQTGAILIGVSDIEVTGLRVTDTAADGLHFNACRRARIDDYVAKNNGDDGLALVTYYAENFFFDAPAETFAFPHLTDWSNADFNVTNVSIDGGDANGSRIAGAQRVTIDGFKVTGKGSGIQVDSATVESDPIWHYVASRRIRLSQISVEDCKIGIQMLARPPDGIIDRRFTDFDVDITDLTINNCSNWAVRVESLTDQRVTGLRVGTSNIHAASTEGGNGAVGLGNADNINFSEMSITHAKPVTAFSAENSGNIQIDRLQIDVDGAVQPGALLAPAAQFKNSDGYITELDVQWKQAPSTWTPVLVTDAGAACGAPDAPAPAPSVAIQVFTVEPPSVVNRIGDC